MPTRSKGSFEAEAHITAPFLKRLLLLQKETNLIYKVVKMPSKIPASK